VPRFPDHPPRRPAVVTGASSGIGAATAQALARAGHPVVLAARRVDACEELVRRIKDEGGEAVACHLDLADSSSTTAFVEEAVGAFGPIEILVSNAAAIVAAAALDTEPAAFERILDINLVNAHRLVSAVARDMVACRAGDVAFVTSDAVNSPRTYMAAYVASKWGLEGYAKALRMELEGTGVRVSVVQPGQTLTGMGTDWDPDAGADVLNDWVRWGFARHSHFLRPEDLAAAVVFAVSARRGTNYATIEVQPEAPLNEEKP
jgi:NAD(P)-dependent dehydrogenase (short-subunit alcohol dehydrogenase family)